MNNYRTREDLFLAIQENPQFDVLIVGAGINGIGTFRDLALQGVRVLMIDKSDFCSGASAASSHMVHGGIRYLENGEFRLVREAVQERNRLLENAPHLVEPLATTIPIFNWSSGLLNAPLKFANLLNKPSERGAIVIKLGLMMYDAYTTGQRNVPKHSFHLREESLKQYPRLNPDITCTATYFDAMMPSPERICMDLINEAVAVNEEALALNYCRVGSAEGDEVAIWDELTNGRFQIQPQVIINAAGPWIDFANDDMGGKTELIGGTKGSHLVLDHPELHAAIQGHEFFFENDDGRIVLIYPLKHRVMIGTSDIPLEDPDEAVCTEAEIDYFLEMVARVFPSIEVTREHIVFTFSGVRPLPANNAKSAGQISRDHQIALIKPGDTINMPVLNLIGGKWTTFRAFSEQATNHTLKLLDKERSVPTQSRPLWGGTHYPKNKDEKWRWLHNLARENDLDFEHAKLLFERYGTLAKSVASYIAQGNDALLASHPGYSRRELQFLAVSEGVVHLDDLILRRTLIGMLGETTLPLLAECADAMGEILQWDEATKANEVARTRHILAEKHRVTLSETAVNS